MFSIAHKMILLEAILYKHYAKHEPMAWAETFRHVNGISPLVLLADAPYCWSNQIKTSKLLNNEKQPQKSVPWHIFPLKCV